MYHSLFLDYCSHTLNAITNDLSLGRQKSMLPVIPSARLASLHLHLPVRICVHFEAMGEYSVQMYVQNTSLTSLHANNTMFYEPYFAVCVCVRERERECVCVCRVE